MKKKFTADAYDAQDAGTKAVVYGHSHDHRDGIAMTRSDALDDEPDEISYDVLLRLGLDDLGTPDDPLPILDNDGVIDQIWGGGTVHAPNDVITYTFLDTPVLTGLYNQGGLGNYFGYQGLAPFTEVQEGAARDAIEMWDDLIAAEFVESEGMGADIVFANNTATGSAYAYRPGPDSNNGPKYISDVFVGDPDVVLANAWFTPGGYGHTTLIHEIGHSVGLSHPGNYNGSAEYYPDAEYAQDTNQFSIMSYFDGTESGAYALNWGLFVGGGPLFNYAQTPQLHDILAIQAAYGADPDTRSGDSTYGFNVSDDVTLWVYDFNENPYPAISIYDAGGEDTIDASGFANSQFIDLHDGAFSSIGGGTLTQLEAYNNAVELFYMTENSEGYGLWAGVPPTTEDMAALLDTYSGFFASWHAADMNLLSFLPEYAGTLSLDPAMYPQFAITTSQYMNVSIAYDTVIENAIGGQGNDGLLGNEVGNILDGQDGNDQIYGYEGDDTIIGGNGSDLMSGGAGADTFVLDSLDAGDLITDFNGAEGDMIDLSGLVGEADAPLSFVEGGFTGAAGEVTYVGGNLMMDGNGDGAADYSVAIINGADIDASMLVLAAGA